MAFILRPNAGVEFTYFSQGLLVAGVDEVGRGALAGPVVSAIVLIDKPDVFDLHVNDSKKLTYLQREKLYDLIVSNFSYGVGVVDNNVIDKIGIRKATYLSMLKAYWSLKKKPDIVLVDGQKSVIKLPFNSYYYTKGDARFYSIAMASIVAKVYRDRLMHKLSSQFPVYDWQANVGYGTLKHRQAIKTYGKCSYHRRTFIGKILDNGAK